MNLKTLFIAIDIEFYENHNIYKDHIFNVKVGNHYKEMTQYSIII